MTPRLATLVVFVASLTGAGCVFATAGARPAAMPLPVEGHSARLAREHGAHPVDEPAPVDARGGGARRTHRGRTPSPARLDAREHPAAHPATVKRAMRVRRGLLTV